MTQATPSPGNMKPQRSIPTLLAMAAMTATCLADSTQYPPKRPDRKNPAAAEGVYQVGGETPGHRIRGLGFEIQSDSIASGNSGLPDAPTSVPNDLTPSERQRFATEMLKGFRYCRLAGGLYWRGTDPQGKFLQDRWPGQLDDLAKVLKLAGVEGASLEYWSPAPFWKANRAYVGDNHDTNRLRCFGPDFAADPDYRGDTKRFFEDFSAALVQDIRTLSNHGIRVRKWGLQNEPRSHMGRPDYSRCGYTLEQYVKTFKAVAPVIRKHDPSIEIICDSWELNYAAPLMQDPVSRQWIDSLVLHHVGCNANEVFHAVANARKRFGNDKPLYQNEYEYLWGSTTPDRCMNTVLHIMNWFQIGKAPCWYWIHALKPITNSEASGYSLGFWRPANDTNPQDHPKFPGLKPGHWTWNPYNWNAVAPFVKRMPWDSSGLDVKETVQDPDLRVFAFRKPDGLRTIVVANRSFSDHTFHIRLASSQNTSFNGYRYTPDQPGPDSRGVPVGNLPGNQLSPKVPDRAWEFWEETR